MPLLPLPTSPIGDRTSAHALRNSLVDARVTLRRVLADRAAAADTVTWSGGHRRRFDDDLDDLLAAGRQLDATLTGLLTALDAELDAG